MKHMDIILFFEINITIALQEINKLNCLMTNFFFTSLVIFARKNILSEHKKKLETKTISVLSIRAQILYKMSLFKIF